MTKLVFFGTPVYVIPVVEALEKNFKNTREKGLIAVVTQAPKPSGRGNKLEYSEIDHWAHKRGIPIIFDFDQIPEADLGIVAAYGKIIPDFTISKFKHGILNIHPSLLPKYRGASPVQAAIAAGEDETGVSIIKMDEKMDHGPIVTSFKEKIRQDDTLETLRARLFQRSAQFLVELIPSFISNKISPKPQNHEEATFTKLITKNDGFVDPVYLSKLLAGEEVDGKMPISFIKEYDLDLSSQSIERLLRALTPWPLLWSTIKINDQEKRLKILACHTKERTLILDKVQLEGKNPVSWEEFKRGYPNYELSK